MGGQYKPLSEQQVGDITESALQILEQIGMGESPDYLVAKACEQGAWVNQHGRLCFPRELVLQQIDVACKQFTLYGRDERHTMQVGGEGVYFGTGGAAVQTLDLETGDYRPSTLADLYDFTRLIDTLDNVSWFTRCCVATDLEDIYQLDINTAYTLLAATQKPVGTSITLAEHVDPIVDMFDIALGEPEAFRKRPFCHVHISPVISPLRYGEDAVAVAMACMRRGVPINNIVAAQSGATSPANLAGMLSTTLAETLAALMMVNLFEPGYPMIFSNWPLVIDLRSGAFCGGGGEISLLNAASAQLSNSLGLPSGAASSMSDAKAVDAQMGLEKAISATAVGLSGCNMIFESSGMMASLLGASAEAFVVDDEMLSHVYRLLRGVEVDSQQLDIQAIEQEVLATGHFLGAEKTLEAMQRDYFYPSEMSDRQPPDGWQESGSLTMQQRANRRAKQILASHRPHYLSAEADAQIRSRFPILLNP